LGDNRVYFCGEGDDDMEFVTVRDFRNSSRDIWKKLESSENIVVTNNGKPTALLIGITEDGFEETLASIRQAKAMRALNRMREQAAEHGFMSDDEIEAEIQAYRTEMREK